MESAGMINDIEYLPNVSDGKMFFGEDTVMPIMGTARYMAWTETQATYEFKVITPLSGGTGIGQWWRYASCSYRIWETFYMKLVMSLWLRLLLSNMTCASDDGMESTE